MELTRRSFAAGLPAVAAGCASLAPVAGDPALVDPYAPEREAALYPVEPPFLAVFERGGRTLGFVTAVHTTERNSRTFSAIRQGLERVRPAALVLEGFPAAWGDNPAKIVEDTRRMTAADADSWERGEGVYAASLAVARGVPFRGGELTDAELHRALTAEGFATDDVFFTSLLGPLAQDLRAKTFAGPADPRFEPAFDGWAGPIAKDIGRKPPSLSEFEGWYVKTFGISLEKDPRWSERGGPGERELPGRIGRASNLLRDRRLFELSLRMLNERRRVLVVYGGSHLSSLWRALEGALERPRIVTIA